MSSNLEQLETCLLYGGVCDYPSNVCYECPKHGRTEPMSDLIDRQAAINALKNERSDWNCDYNIPVDHCIDAIYSLPSAQPDPCEDAVSRNAAIEQIKWWFGLLKQNPDILIDAIKTLPSVTPKRKTGRWAIKKGVLHPLEIDGICSKCGYTTGFYTLFKFCPNCGAEMNGGEQE